MRSLGTPARCIPPSPACPRTPPHRWPAAATRAPGPRQGSARLLPCTPQCSAAPATPALTLAFRRGVCPRPPAPAASHPCPPKPFLPQGNPRARTLGAPASSRQARTRRHGAQTALAAGVPRAQSGAAASRRPRHRRAQLTRLLRCGACAVARAAGDRSRLRAAAGTAGRGAGGGGTTEGGGAGAGRGIPTQRGGRVTTPSPRGIERVWEQKYSPPPPPPPPFRDSR